MANYSEKLKDPKWQKKRLEIMERDNFCCKNCYDDENTLCVHHLYYKSNTDPWDYPDESLITLCEECHEEEHSKRKEMEYLLLYALKEKGFLADDVFDIAEMIHSMNFYVYSKKNLLENILSLNKTGKER